MVEVVVLVVETVEVVVDVDVVGDVVVVLVVGDVVVVLVVNDVVVVLVVGDVVVVLVDGEVVPVVVVLVVGDVVPEVDVVEELLVDWAVVAVDEVVVLTVVGTTDVPQAPMLNETVVSNRTIRTLVAKVARIDTPVSVLKGVGHYHAGSRGSKVGWS